MSHHTRINALLSKVAVTMWPSARRYIWHWRISLFRLSNHLCLVNRAPRYRYSSAPKEFYKTVPSSRVYRRIHCIPFTGAGPLTTISIITHTEYLHRQSQSCMAASCPFYSITGSTHRWTWIYSSGIWTWHQELSDPGKYWYHILAWSELYKSSYCTWGLP